MKHPKELRLTFKEQRDPGYWDIDKVWKQGDVATALGFAQVYEPHLKSFAKKQNTQDEWAYGGYFYEDGKVWTRSYYWKQATDPNQGSVCLEKVEIVQEYLQPQIIENVPMEGFRIQKSVSRYSTSNKLWRVLDPRGFELEIATGCFEDLVMDCVIDHGVIMAPCIWHTGKMLVKA